MFLALKKDQILNLMAMGPFPLAVRRFRPTLNFIEQLLYR